MQEAHTQIYKEMKGPPLKMKKILSLILITALLLSGCAGKNKKETVKLGLIQGPSGMGAAYLMEQNSAGKCENTYDVTLETDISNITSAMISGALDLAAVPTNVAATLYNKTNGKIKVVALSTLSVLYILENGNSISDISDLAGKTIYAMGQGANPEHVLNYVLAQNGLDNVTVEFLDSGELTTRMASGTIDICMLPVPAATSVLMKNADVRIALSIGEEWAAVSDSALTQGCIVARAEIGRAHV